MKRYNILLFVSVVIMLLLQIWVFSGMSILRYATPMPYVMLAMLFPIATPKVYMVLFGGGVGLILDYFLLTPGLHMAAFTAVCFLRGLFLPYAFPVDVPQESPCVLRLGSLRVSLFLLLLLSIHHVLLFALEGWGEVDWLYVLMRCLASLSVSYVMAWIALLLWGGRAKESRFR